MRTAHFATYAFLATVFVALAACGGGGGGGGGGTPGTAVMTDVPVKWRDMDGNGAINDGDGLVLAFDRLCVSAAMTPNASTVVMNGTIPIPATWTDGPLGSEVTITLAGGPTTAPGTVGPPPRTTINLNPIPGNDLTNPFDGTVGATPATAAQSIMANVSTPGTDLGTAPTNDVKVMNYDFNAAEDIAFGVTGPNMSFYGNGDGTFAPLAVNWRGEPAGGLDTRGLVFIDTNADGTAEWIVTGNGSAVGQPNYVYQVNNAVPMARPIHDWIAQPIPPLDVPLVELGNNRTRAIGTADFNGDTHPDIVCGNAGAPSRLYFSLNGGFDGRFDGDNSLALATDFLPFGPIQDVWALDVGDINGAGQLDFAMVYDVPGGAELRAYLVTAGGVAIPMPQPGVVAGAPIALPGPARSVHLCNLDADPALECLVGVTGGGIQIFDDLGANPWFNLIGTLGTDSPFGIECVDLNLDGALDIVSANANNQPNKVWLNTGGLTFVDSGLRMGTGSSFAVDASATATGRGLDGRGVQDFVVANNSSVNVLYWTGR